MQTLEEIAADLAQKSGLDRLVDIRNLCAGILAALRAERERCALAATVRAQKLRRAATPGAFPIADAFDDFAAAIRNQP